MNKDTWTHNGVKYEQTDLLEGESIPNPASTKQKIWGPCRVTKKTYPDGGIDVEISDPMEA